MATFGTGAGSVQNAASGTVSVTPPASATIMVGGIAVGNNASPTINALTWDGNNMTQQASRTDASALTCGLDYYVSPGTSAANIAGGGGAASDWLWLAGVGIAGSETSSPVRDSTNGGEVTGGADISWTPTGLATGDAMVIMAITDFNVSIAAGAGTTAAYLDDNGGGGFNYSTILAVKIATSSSDTIDVACDGLTQWCGVCIKTAAAGTPVTIFVQNYD